jgi:uncharacterized membrane protein
VAGALVAHQADGFGFSDLVPDIDKESIGGLLDTISATMLVISIFAVTSMLSAFSLASSTATPRSFKIIVTDDVSQNALSIFIGAFIFSIVATIALDNGYYGKTGRFILFLLTLLFFVVVILTFLWWVDRISRLGRMEQTIKQMEEVAGDSLSTYIKNPYLKALPSSGENHNGKAVYADTTGYVQHINLEVLQDFAEEQELQIQLNCLPGNFVHNNYIVAYVNTDAGLEDDQIRDSINSAILIGQSRLFDEDPRFGLISLSEIASRALSPGINDPGTAIQIIGSHERLFFLWHEAHEDSAENTVTYNRVAVPRIEMEDFFDDAFRPIARDGAANIEVMLRLQKAFRAIATIKNAAIKEQAIKNSKEAFHRAENAMQYKSDLDSLEKQCLFRRE